MHQSRSNQKKNKTLFRGRPAVHPELETLLAEFVRELRARSLPVTAECVRVKALEIARDSGHTRVRFKGSPSWVRRFMKRKGFALRRRTSVCQKLPEDFDHKLVEYQHFIIELRRQRYYMMGHMGNADETPI
ncbi:hypothetical protein MTO96_018954 [Rhipicephalus appendiculatus]